MDKLLGWVKQIFVISILSELVIHILPDEKYEGVVRLLCGCMITAACIMPVLNIINAEYDADIDLFAKTSQISELRSQIRFSGKDSSDVMIEKYIETQQEFVTKKVMEEGFTPSEVEIVIDTDEDSDTYLDVQKINIAIDKKDKKIFYIFLDEVQNVDKFEYVVNKEIVISEKVINLRSSIAQYYELNSGLVNIYIL